MASGPTIPGLITANAELLAAAELIDRVAPTRVSVLILGETGTGKELLARAVHERSGRRGRFVPVDCGALPEPLVEALLFGHTRGAFTGASASGEGLFRHAQGGTLLLDEVGNLPAPAQLSLLRVLQERRVRPVGSAEEVAVDVRVIAATSEDLVVAVQEGRFREDLLYRLDVIRVEVPPLRRRPEDLPLLFDHFLATLCERHGVAPPRVDPALRRALGDYDWPGNVRQLENVVERLVLTRAAASGELDVADLELSQARPTTPPSTAASPLSRALLLAEGDATRPTRTLEEAVDQAERTYLERLLEDHGGRMEDAARAGGVSRRTLQRKLKKHGLDRRAFDEAEEERWAGLWLVCAPFAPLRLGPGQRTVGRDPGCDLCLPHTQVSRRHLELVTEQDEVWVQDAGSTNGTLLNGAPLLELTQLHEGDVLDVGVFRITAVDSPAEGPQQEDTGPLGKARSVELGPGRLRALLAELAAQGASATLQVHPVSGTEGGLWVEDGEVVRAWLGALRGDSALRALDACEAGDCLVYELSASRTRGAQTG
ncbi:MAG: sigma 54-interacting transcriptional regulator [Planctomycetota bacterium]